MCGGTATPTSSRPGDWTDFTVKRRHVEFAWGPTADKTLRRVAAIEFVVAAGKGGGKGWIAVDDLTLRRLPEPPSVPPPVIARGEGAKAVDGNAATAWERVRQARSTSTSAMRASSAGWCCAGVGSAPRRL